MRKSRFTESQIVAVLKEGETGIRVTEIIRKHGISRNTYFSWKARYSGGRARTASPFSLQQLLDRGVLERQVAVHP